MKQENNRIPIQTELRSWNYVDIVNARSYLVEHFQIDRTYTESLPISFDDEGHLITFKLKGLLTKKEIETLSNYYKRQPVGSWVYKILDDMGYPKYLFPGWRPRFYMNGRLDHSDLIWVMGHKDIIVLQDMIYRKIQDAVGFDPLEKELSEFDETKHEREYFPDHPVFTDLNKNMRALLEKEGYADEAPPQSMFVIEETSELVVELMKLVKILCKEEHKKVNREDVFGEACDVMASIMMFFVRNGYPTHDVFTYISGKYRRAAERFTDKKEL